MVGDGPHLHFREGSNEADGINFETIVEPGDTLIFHNASGGKIKSFKGIKMYTDDPTGTDMLRNVEPGAEVMSVKVFTPASMNHGELHENYFVTYENQAGGIIDEDPKIRMKGKGA